MRIGIVGSRSFSNFDLMERHILSAPTLTGQDIKAIVTGGAQGADSLAIELARKYKWKSIEYLPMWDKFPGKSASYHRNKLIVENSDIVFAFWNGKSRGTKMTIDICHELNTPCIVTMFRETVPTKEEVKKWNS